MLSKFSWVIVWLACLVLVSGCVAPLIIGGALGAAGGYAISRDTVQGVVERSYDEVWEASVQILKDMGALDFSYKPGGKYRAFIRESRVNLKVEQMSQDEVRLTVSARKGIFPRLKLAQEIFIKIIEKTK
ncbi:MAG: hypothetical protein V1674_04640 [Candidatus Omnitrophota bacterium]